MVGLDEASGFVSVVGQEMGDEMNRGYKNALGVSNLNRQQVSDVLVDLKRRIQGDFFIILRKEGILSNRHQYSRLVLLIQFSITTAVNLGHPRDEFLIVVAVPWLINFE